MMSEANPYSSPLHGGKELVGSGQLASLGDRFLAALIDFVVLIPFSCVVFFVIGMIVPLTNEGGQVIMRSISTAMNVAGGLGAYLALHGYLLSTRGQTVGKMIVKTKIVADDGSTVPFATILLKRILPMWAIGLIPCIGFIVWIVDVCMIFRENRKCLHDDIAGTKVIKLAG
jgi:uncharacterized RDD family membrane protein YckC